MNQSECPNCERMLSGSASKGRNTYFYYYHCTSSCGTRFKAGIVNDVFKKQLQHLSPKEGMVAIFIKAFIKDFNNKTKTQNSERSNIVSEIDSMNKRYQNAFLKNADGEMADDDFQAVKQLTKKKIGNLENRLSDLSTINSEIKDLVAIALKKAELIPTLLFKFSRHKKSLTFL